MSATVEMTPEEEPVNPISIELARQLAEDRRIRLRRSFLRRSFERTPPTRPHPEVEWFGD